MTLDIQLQTMIIMTIGGFYLGISLDTFRRFSPYWNKNIVWKYMLECCFWLVQTFILFYVLYLVNSGELRLYIFAACLLGFAMYQVLAATLYKRLLEKIIVLLYATSRFLVRLFNNVVFRPMKWVFFTLFAIVLFCIRIIVTITLFFLQPIIHLFILPLKKVYRLLPASFKRILYKFAGLYSIIENTLTRWITYLTFKRR